MICRSGELKELGKRYSMHGLLKCRSCGFVFCRQIPSDEELQAHYKKYPRNDKISPITIKRYNELLDYFERSRKTNNMLDIGCGDGYFLKEAMKRNWQVYGVEFTSEAIDICVSKGIRMHAGVLNESNYSKEQFDVVTSFEVIEHINNPIDEMEKINRLTRKGGLFYVTTPNFNSVSRNILKEKWNIIEYPEHLSYYTTSTLCKLAKENGFLPVECKTTGLSMDRMRKSSGNVVQQAGSDEDIREKVEAVWYYKLVKNSINYLLTVFGKGDSLKAVFQKT